MKPWYKSKIILFNLAAVLVAFAVGSLEVFRSLMSPTAYAVFSLAVGVVNVFLRFITSQPLMTDKE